MTTPFWPRRVPGPKPPEPDDMKPGDILKPDGGVSPSP